jgi:hypothetical protein
MDGLNTDIYDALIGRIYGHGSHVAFEYAPPIFAPIISSVQAVLSNT